MPPGKPLCDLLRWLRTTERAQIVMSEHPRHPVGCESPAERRRRRARFLIELAQDRELVERVYPQAAAKRRAQRRMATYRR